MDLKFTTILISVVLMSILKCVYAENLNNRKILLGDKGFQSLYGAKQVYMAPNGKDSGYCVKNVPCKTFSYAISHMDSGDALILQPGKYTLKENGSLSYTDKNGNSIKYSSQLPTGISSAKPTIARAEIPGTVEIESGFTLGTKNKKVKYVVIYGLTFLNPSYLRNADYSVVKSTGIKGMLGVGTNDHSQGCVFNLIEDVWIWGKNFRGNAVNYRAHHNIWRRVLIRDDGCDEANCGEGGGNYSIGMTIYNSHDVIAENVLIFDRVLGSNPYGYADFATAQHNSNRGPLPEGEANGSNQWLGCMSINSEDRAINFEADVTLDSPDVTGRIKDFYAFKSRYGLSIDGAHRPYEGNSFFEIDNIYLYTTDDQEYYIGCDVVNKLNDTGCNHNIRSVHRGRYKAGMANKLLPEHRYGTQINLWPWPNEKIIKKDICSHNNEIARGFCEYPGNLSDYIRSF